MDMNQVISSAGLKKNAQINLNFNKKPSIDIVIPFHNQYESLIKCYSSIQNFTPNQEYFVYLVDDASNNKEFTNQFCANRKRTFGIRSEEHVGFGAAVNAGINSGNSQLVCVMHSDVFVDNIYWLKHLQENLEKGKLQNIKFVSARISSAGSASDFPKELIENSTESEIFPSEKPLPWTCCLFERDFFNKIGPLKTYFPAWFEDVEYFNRMSKRGFNQAVATRPFLQHHGSRTINEVIKYPNMRKQLENNLYICLKDIKK